jgi:hypothetical protein
MIPNNPTVGEIEIIKAYDFYDYPRSFIAKNDRGDIYFVLWIGDDKKGDSWYYLPITENKKNLLMTNSIDMRNALLNLEMGYLYEVITLWYMSAEHIDSVEKIYKVDKNVLPEKGQFLDLGLMKK